MYQEEAERENDAAPQRDKMILEKEKKISRGFESKWRRMCSRMQRLGKKKGKSRRKKRRHE